MDGVSPLMVVGSSTEVIAGEKMIVTAGAIDAHIHYICPQQWEEVCNLAGGILIRDLIPPGISIGNDDIHWRRNWSFRW